MAASGGRMVDRFLPGKWRNPYEDFQLHYWTLNFFSGEAEQGFSLDLSRRLARHVRVIGGILFAVEVFWLATTDFSKHPDHNALSHKAKLVARCLDAFMGLVGLSMVVVGTLQARQLVLLPKLFEAFVVACLISLLGAAPFTDAQMVLDVVWPEGGIFLNHCSSFVLMSDCIVTVGSLMPLRWSFLWLLDVLALLWFPALQLTASQRQLDDQYFALVLLILCSALGKREMEVQERRLFRTVAVERTMRATSEFQQSHSLSAERPLGPPSVAPSMETGELFNLHSALAGEVGIHSALQRVKGVAEREQWLIPQTEISIDASKVIGVGGFGAVVEASLGGCPVAVKLSLQAMGSQDAVGLPNLVSELRVLRKVRHPNVVLFLGAVIDPELCEVAMILEFVDGPDLKSFISSGRWNDDQPLPDSCLYKISCDMARALRYLHGHTPPIVHGDLKPGNILLEHAASKSPRAKLVDFGLSRILSGNAQDMGGTLAWMAPELFSGDRRPSTSVDIYGSGRIISYMLTRTEPYPGRTAADIRALLRRGRLPDITLPYRASIFAQALNELVVECVALRTSDRPSMGQVCERLLDFSHHSVFKESLGSVARELWGSVGAGSGGSSNIRSVDGLDPRSMAEFASQDMSSWELAVPKLRSALSRSGHQDASGAAESVVTSGQVGNSSTRLAPVPEGLGLARSAVAEQPSDIEDQEASLPTGKGLDLQHAQRLAL